MQQDHDLRSTLCDALVWRLEVGEQPDLLLNSLALLTLRAARARDAGTPRRGHTAARGGSWRVFLARPRLSASSRAPGPAAESKGSWVLLLSATRCAELAARNSLRGALGGAFGRRSSSGSCIEGGSVLRIATIDYSD